MLILGIESTCDETAASVVRDGTDVLSSVVATQYHLHAKFRGVVPEIASRAHIENILPVLQQSCDEASVTLKDLDAIAVAHRPGLVGSLLIGVTAAKTLAYLLNKPLIGVDHVQAHLYSVMLKPCPAPEAQFNPPPEGEGGPKGRERVPPASPLTPGGSAAHAAPSGGPPSFPGPHAAARGIFPAAGAVLSGGHTALYRVNSWTDATILGGTIDDAIGEAYDKVAATLGLPFPGGPAVAALAESGDPKAIRFPRSLFERDSLDMSLSGLKTAVLYAALGHKGKERTADQLSQQEKADLAASFQAAVLDVLTEKLLRLIKKINAKSLLLGGGVTSNTVLRARLTNLGIPTHLPEKQYCTDNAAMSAGLAHVLLEQGKTSDLSLDAITNSSIPLA